MNIYLIIGIAILIIGIPIGFLKKNGKSKKTGNHRTPRNKA